MMNEMTAPGYNGDDPFPRVPVSSSVAPRTGSGAHELTAKVYDKATPRPPNASVAPAPVGGTTIIVNASAAAAAASKVAPAPGGSVKVAPAPDGSVVVKGRTEVPAVAPRGFCC